MPISWVQYLIIVQKWEDLIPGPNIYREFKDEHCCLLGLVKFYPTCMSMCTWTLFRETLENFAQIFEEREILPKGIVKGIKEPSLVMRLKVKFSIFWN